MKNRISKIAKVFGIVTASMGGILGLYYMIDYDGTIGAIVLVAGLISGFFFYAFGEIIQLLQDIKDNTKELDKVAKHTKSAFTVDTNELPGI